MGHIFAKRIKLSGGHYTVTFPESTISKPGAHIAFAIITHEKKPATGNRRSNFSHFPFGQYSNSEGESASLNYQLLTSDGGWLPANRAPQSVYNRGSQSSSVQGTFTDRRAGRTYEDEGTTYVNSTFIRSNAGDNPHNNIPPIYGVYRFRRIS